MDNSQKEIPATGKDQSDIGSWRPPVFSLTYRPRDDHDQKSLAVSMIDWFWQNPCFDFRSLARKNDKGSLGLRFIIRFLKGNRLIRGVLGKRSVGQATLSNKEIRTQDRSRDLQVDGSFKDRLGSKAHSLRIETAIDVLRDVPFQELQRRGWHFQPVHFYYPLNDLKFLAENRHLWHSRDLPAGINWNIANQVQLARKVYTYVPELAGVPIAQARNQEKFTWENSAFSGSDAAVYYGIVRHNRPQRVVEIGSGWSGLVLKEASIANEEEIEVEIIEPYPNEGFLAALPPRWHVQQTVIQNADLSSIERLRAGDICFYDGSHCVRTASDVNWFFFEILPRIAAGVWIHVHDIFFPDDYHDHWVFQEGLSWNEQYLLQAFLMHNDAYEVVIANRMLHRLKPDCVSGQPLSDGGSFWFRKIKAD